MASNTSVISSFSFKKSQETELIIINKGKIYSQYDETEVESYMKSSAINISIDIGNGKKSFTVYTMDLTKEYININTVYRS